MSATTNPELTKLRLDLKAAKYERDRFVRDQKELGRVLRDTSEPEQRVLLQARVDQANKDLDAAIDAVQAISLNMRPLLEAEAGAHGRLPVSTNSMLKTTFHCDDTYIKIHFVETYKEICEANPDWMLPPLRAILDKLDVILVLGLVEHVHVLPGEDRTTLSKRINQTTMTETDKAAIRAAIANNFPSHGQRAGRFVAWVADIAAARDVVDDIPVDIDAVTAPCIHDYACHVLDQAEPKRDYQSFAVEYFELLAKEGRLQNPYFIRCVAKVDPDAGSNNRPMTAHWMCTAGLPSQAHINVFNAAIAPCVPTIDARTTSVALGHAPYGCENKADTPISPGHNKLMLVISALCLHLRVFLRELPVDTSKDDATGANAHYYLRKLLVWFGGLGLEALRMIMRALARQGLDDGISYADMSDAELTKVLIEIATTNADPVSGFGVLRPDWKDYRTAFTETQLTPTFATTVAYLTAFKYVSYVTLPSTADDADCRHALVIQYGNHPEVVMPIAKGFLRQPLSEGEGTRGHGPLRKALERHLGFGPTGNDSADAIIKSLYATIRPVDFPRRSPLSDNPFLLCSPSPISEAVLETSDDCQYGKTPYFNIAYRVRLFRFDPQRFVMNAKSAAVASTSQLSTSMQVHEEWATEAETLLYDFPRKPYNATDDEEFRQSIPTQITPRKFSASIAPYIKNLNTLGNTKGFLDSLDVLVGSDLTRQMFPAAPIVVDKVRKEIPMVFHIPDRADDDDKMMDQGKSAFALAVSGTSNLYLQVTPTTGTDSAPAQRVLKAEFDLCDRTFFVDDGYEISSPTHILHYRQLLGIATNGKGPSPGIAGGNGSSLIYGHMVTFTRKYAPSEPLDLITRAWIYYHYVLTAETKMTDEQFAYFSSMKFRIQARLDFLAWMFTSGYAKTVYKATPRRVATRMNGHDGLAAVLLGDGTQIDADTTAYAQYMRDSQGDKCKAQYAEAVANNVVSRDSGTTTINMIDWFQQASAFTLAGIAMDLVSNECARSTSDVWKAVVAGDRTEDYHRIAASNGFGKVRGGIGGLVKQFFKAAQEGTLQRDDGWIASVKSVTIQTGSRTPRIVLHNDLTKGQSDDYSEAKVMETLRIMRKKYGKGDTASG